MNRMVLAASLALPIVALGAGIVAAEAGARGATVWRLPITGYDPRDPVRGHYVRYRYDWRVTGNGALCRTGCALCLEDGGRVVRVVAKDGACPARIDPVSSRIGLRPAPEFLATPLAATGQIYVSESSAPRLTAMLAKGPAVVVARLTRDGRLIPDRIEPAA